MDTNVCPTEKHCDEPTQVFTAPDQNVRQTTDAQRSGRAQDDGGTSTKTVDLTGNSSYFR
jgi:hypothetical protein